MVGTQGTGAEYLFSSPPFTALLEELRWHTECVVVHLLKVALRISMYFFVILTQSLVEQQCSANGIIFLERSCFFTQKCCNLSNLLIYSHMDQAW